MNITSRQVRNLPQAALWQLAADIVTEVTQFWPKHLGNHTQELESLVRCVQQLLSIRLNPSSSSLTDIDPRAIDSERLWDELNDMAPYERQGVAVLRCIRTVVRGIVGTTQGRTLTLAKPPHPPTLRAQVGLPIPVDLEDEIKSALEELERLRAFAR